MKSNIFLRFLFISFIIVLPMGCKKESVEARKLAIQIPTNAGAIETQNGTYYLMQLHDAGRLPGEPTNYVGQLSSDIIPFSTNQLEYPVIRTYHLFKTHDPIMYNYTVSKPSNGAPWMLLRAWKSGANNQVVEEWPVK